LETQSGPEELFYSPDEFWPPLSPESVPSVSAGADFVFSKNILLRLEGFYTERTLPPRTSSTWFSASPALPERDFRLYAGSLVFNMPRFGFAADGAYSETFAFGRDFYGNLGLRLGDKPWRLSLAADGAGSRYVGSDGSVPGQGFRSAARLERRGKGSSLFRLAAVLRWETPLFGETMEGPERSSFSAYYRLPSSRAPAALSRVSLTVNRDSRDEDAVLDSGDILAGIKLGPFSSVTEFKLSTKDNDFASLGIQESVSWKIRLINFIARTGYTNTAGKDDLWDGSLSASVRGKLRSGKRGRLSVKAASTDFPEKWEYTIGWRVEL
jgi:hypothetical protein